MCLVDLRATNQPTSSGQRPSQNNPPDPERRIHSFFPPVLSCPVLSRHQTCRKSPPPPPPPSPPPSPSPSPSPSNRRRVLNFQLQAASSCSPASPLHRRSVVDICGINHIMKGRVADKQCSYRYWVRDATDDAAPLPVPSLQEDLSLSLSLSLSKQPPQSTTTLTLGSVWNQAFLVTVRNKNRVGYTYELTLKFKGEWLIQEERKKIKGQLDIPEFSYGELEDLQIEVRFNEKDIASEDKMCVSRDLRLFLAPIREKLLDFERELKDR